MPQYAKKSKYIWMIVRSYVIILIKIIIMGDVTNAASTAAVASPSIFVDQLVVIISSSSYR